MFRDPRDPRLIAKAAWKRREGESDYALAARLDRLCIQLAEELAELQGQGQAVQPGCTLHELYLSDAPVLIEFDDAAGQPCGMLVNGKWVDPYDCVSAEQIEQWREQIDEAARIVRQEAAEGL